MRRVICLSAFCMHVSASACACACGCVHAFVSYEWKEQKVNDDLPDYLTFPEHPLLKRFRHEWIMVPHRRPHVPVFAKSKMPRAGMKDEEKAQLCSLYFRPWTLCADFAALPHVPHLLQLPLYPEPIVRRRKRVKGKAAAEETLPSWASSWARYIRGNVVSEHAARLIRRFLSLTLARSGSNARNPDDEGDSEIDDLEGHGAVPVKVGLDEAHRIIRSEADGQDASAQGNVTAAKRLKNTKGVLAHWSTKSRSSPSEGTWDCSGNHDTNQIEEYKKAAISFGKAHGDKALRSSLLHVCPLVFELVHVDVMTRVLVISYLY